MSVAPHKGDVGPERPVVSGAVHADEEKEDDPWLEFAEMVLANMSWKTMELRYMLTPKEQKRCERKVYDWAREVTAQEEQNE